MVEDLDAACLQSADLPVGPPLVVARRVKTGKRGRPRVVIEERFLTQALVLRGPTHIAPVVGCSPRTVRRRALDYQLVEQGLPVVTTSAQMDGTVLRTWTSTTASVALLTDEQLDITVREILEVRTFISGVSTVLNILGTRFSLVLVGACFEDV